MGDEMLEPPATVEVANNLDWWNINKGRLARQLGGGLTPDPAKNARMESYLRLRKKMATDILRNVYGSHSFYSAFTGVDFGSNDNGILRATVADILHTVEEGLVNRLLSVLFDPMPETMKAAIDKLVEELFCMGRNRSGERDRFPRVSFQKGYSSLTLLSANERLGQLFVVAILLNTPEGRELFSARFDPDFDEKRRENQERFKKKGSRDKAKKNEEGGRAVGTAVAGGEVLTDCWGKRMTDRPRFSATYNKTPTLSIILLI
jgi:hypothetical protein